MGARLGTIIESGKRTKIRGLCLLFIFVDVRLIWQVQRVPTAVFDVNKVTVTTVTWYTFIFHSGARMCVWRAPQEVHLSR